MKSSKYSPYLQMKMVPAGIILERIIREQHRAKNEVAASAQLVPQRVNDLIRGTRRFTPKTSMALENALSIDIPGLFYLIQANHDVHLGIQENKSFNRPNLKILTKTTFWDVDLNKVDWSQCRKWAIRRVLEYGTPDEIREIDRFYGHDALLEIFNNPQGFRLYEQVQQNYKKAAL
ncbi:MAG: XRE family transcriptional regulator [Bacteroidales bacterium]|nr:XRE family transcriptional regulator [Bacteroidales bacterium]